MKLTSPLPQTLQKECIKSAEIFTSFASGKRGLDGIIPRHVLQRASGFAILSVAKAGFLISARAGSGLVIARLDDDTWSAPSAIGTAGMGFGSQAGAEVTDFLFVLNTKSAVRSFMSAGSVTLGGSLSVALGPVGRTGEAGGTLNTNGHVAAMYTYSKSKGIFGGASIEGSIIVERQDANCIAYNSNVSAQMLLSGVVPVPQWADGLIRAIEVVTGQEGGLKWVRNETPVLTPDYAFGGVGSPGSVVKKKKSTPKNEFPPKSWGSPKDEGSYFDAWERDPNEAATTRQEANLIDVNTPSPSGNRARTFSNPFDATNADIKVSADRMTSPFDISAMKRTTSMTSRPKPLRTESETSLKMKSRAAQLSSQLEGELSAFSRLTFSRSNSNAPPPPPPTQGNLIDYQDDPVHNPVPQDDPNLPFHLQEVHVDLDKTNVELPSPTRIRPAVLRKASRKHDSDSESEEEVSHFKRAPSQRFKAALKEPLAPAGVGRAVVRFDFEAVEAEDLTMHKGDIVTILERTGDVNDWWRGRIDNRVGNFPANFVEVVGEGASGKELDPFD